MRAFLIWATAAMGVAVGLLMLQIVVRRLRSDRRRARTDPVRAELIETIARYLAVDDAPPPALPAGRESRQVARAVGIEILAEVRGQERRRLLELLEQSGIVADAVRQLRSRRANRRGEAAEMLAYMTSDRALPQLMAGLSDRRVENRLACAAALAEIDDERPVPAILDLCDRTAAHRPGPVAAILVALGRRASGGLREAMSPPSCPELRRLAFAVAGELRLHEHVKILRGGLRSPDDELVARAARGLGLIGDADSVPGLLELAADEGRPWFVRLAAGSALGAIGDAQAVPVLTRLLDGEPWQLQETAARALSVLGEPGRRALESSLASASPTARRLARATLAR